VVITIVRFTLNWTKEVKKGVTLMEALKKSLKKNPEKKAG